MSPSGVLGAEPSTRNGEAIWLLEDKEACDTTRQGGSGFRLPHEWVTGKRRISATSAARIRLEWCFLRLVCFQTVSDSDVSDGVIAAGGQQPWQLG